MVSVDMDAGYTASHPKSIATLDMIHSTSAGQTSSFIHHLSDAPQDTLGKNGDICFEYSDNSVLVDGSQLLKYSDRGTQKILEAPTTTTMEAIRISRRAIPNRAIMYSVQIENLAKFKDRILSAKEVEITVAGTAFILQVEKIAMGFFNANINNTI